jgi:hypothetical protein
MIDEYVSPERVALGCNMVGVSDRGRTLACGAAGEETAVGVWDSARSNLRPTYCKACISIPSNEGTWSGGSFIGAPAGDDTAVGH